MTQTVIYDFPTQKTPRKVFVAKGNGIEARKEAKKLQKIEKEAGRVLYCVKSTFPFDFFPDEIIIRESRIDVVKGLFFYSKYTHPMLLKNILGVTISTTLLFASMSFELRGFETNPEPVRFLDLGEATRAKRIITGLLACSKENVDLSTVSVEEVLAKVEEIGISRVD